MRKTIVVTGAGTGLGRSLARALTANGHRCVLLGRRLDKVAAVADELSGGTLAFGCDVGDPASVDAVFARIAAELGGIDVLINNAGVYYPFMIAEATIAQIKASIDTNLAGPIFCSRAAVAMMGKGGQIISIGSETVVEPAAMLALYQTTKAGLERFCRTLRQELAPRGIRVMLVRASKMYEPTMEMPFPMDVAQRFAEENLKIGVDNRKSPISHFDSASAVIARLIDQPDDINVPEIVLEARFV